MNRTPDAHYDVLILGAGINGAGAFRDLCLQGVKCLMVDADDFCAGASAAPSRLIHGGVKYLEAGEFRLVAQSTLERNLLLRNAPHYVKPIETVLPMRSWFGGILPSILRFLGRPAKLKDRGLLICKLGLEMFDHFGRRRRVLPRHSVRLKAATRRAFSDMAPDIVATASYFDARVTHAERLGLELALDGMAAEPRSLALNHCAVTGRRGRAVELTDRIDGGQHLVTADVILNVAGAWIDRVNAALGLTTRYIGGAKGSHLILQNPALLKALDGKLVYFGASDGRVGLLYPFFGRVLIGSTDIPVEDPDRAVCEDSERDYMLEIVREVFPRLRIDAGQVRYVYCGVRPLPRSDAADPGAVSRDHSIAQDRLEGVPVFSLIGGKWTTFRGFAEEAADRALAALGRPRLRSTEGEPIGGGRFYPADVGGRAQLAAELGVAPARGAALIKRYGTRAREVARAVAARPDSALRCAPDYSRNEIAFLFAQELVGRLADVVFRRTDLALSARLTRDVAREIAEIGAQVQGWDAARLALELADVAERAWRRHAIADFHPARPISTTEDKIREEQL